MHDIEVGAAQAATPRNAYQVGTDIRPAAANCNSWPRTGHAATMRATTKTSTHRSKEAVAVMLRAAAALGGRHYRKALGWPSMLKNKGTMGIEPSAGHLWPQLVPVACV